MSMKSRDPLSPFIGPGAEAFKLWVSFWPVAPLFGVEWRFADAMGMKAAPAARKARPGDNGAAPRAQTADPVVVPMPAPRARTETAAEAPAEAPKAEPKAEAEGGDAPAALAPRADSATPGTPTAEAAPAETPTTAPAKPAGLMDAAPARADDLKLIRGIGPGLESKLNALGVYTFEQIAGFTEADLTWIDENLTAFKGRCFRDDWVGQARDLRG